MDDAHPGSSAESRPRFFSRAGFHRMLEGAPAHAGRRLVRIALAALILANVSAVVVESIDSVESRHRTLFLWFEWVSVVIFTLEVLLRIWVCVEDPRYAGPGGRLRYALTPMLLIDILAIAPTWLGPLVTVDTRMLRALRLLRIFKLTRHSSSMDLLLTVIRQEAPTVLSAMFIMLIVITLAASGIYVIERDAHPEAFDNIPKAMWWAAVTLTTVGYGDVVPRTVLGKTFGLLITVAGVGMVALPAGILASGFSLELQRRREEFRLRVRDSISAGARSPAERDALDEERELLGIAEDEADQLIRAERAESVVREGSCPHCGRPLTG